MDLRCVTFVFQLTENHSNKSGLYEKTLQTVLIYTNCGFHFSFSFLSSGRTANHVVTLDRTERDPILVLTRVICKSCRSLNPLHFSNQWRFTMGGRTGIWGQSLKKTKKSFLRVMSSDMWVKSGFDWSTFHRQLSFHHAAREGDCSGMAAMLRRKHNDIRRCFETQVDCVNREHTQRRSGRNGNIQFNSSISPPYRLTLSSIFEW